MTGAPDPGKRRKDAFRCGDDLPEESYVTVVSVLPAWPPRQPKARRGTQQPAAPLVVPPPDADRARARRRLPGRPGGR
jgi:hypothetical protein